MKHGIEANWPSDMNILRVDHVTDMLYLLGAAMLTSLRTAVLSDSEILNSLENLSLIYSSTAGSNPPKAKQKHIQ